MHICVVAPEVRLSTELQIATPRIRAFELAIGEHVASDDFGLAVRGRSVMATALLRWRTRLTRIDGRREGLKIGGDAVYCRLRKSDGTVRLSVIFLDPSVNGSTYRESDGGGCPNDIARRRGRPGGARVNEESWCCLKTKIVRGSSKTKSCVIFERSPW